MPILSQIFGKRLKQLREGAGLSKVALAKKIGVSDNQIRRWEDGKARPRPETEDLLAEIFEINPIELYAPPGTGAFIEELKPRAEAARAVGKRIGSFRNGRRIDSLSTLARISNEEWLQYESGEMLPNIDVAKRIAEALGYSVIEVLGEEARHLAGGSQDEFVLVPHFDVEVSAGWGAAGEDKPPMAKLAFRRNWIIGQRGLDKGSLFAVSVKGNSMEPDLSEGDIVLVDGSRVDISEDGLYVLRLGGWLFVKRVQRLPGSKIRVISINPEYQPFEVDLADPPEDIQLLGKVVWFGREV